MKDFDIAKFLRENQLGSYGILNYYVDLKPLKEEDDTTEVELNTEIPYEGPEHKLTGNGEGDEFEQAETVSEQMPGDDTRMMDLGGNMIEQGVISLMDDGFPAEDVLELCQMLVNDQYGAKASGMQLEEDSMGANRIMDIGGNSMEQAIFRLKDSGFDAEDVENLFKVLMSHHFGNEDEYDMEDEDIEEGEVDEEWYPHDEESLEKGRAKIIKKK